MSPWIEQILSAFTEDLSRLWIATDPDDVLLQEQVLLGLREKGFELISFQDSVAFRAEYEERYRSAWDRGEDGPAKALVLHLRGSRTSDLPWDYLRQARQVSLSLANLFPKLSYPVVRQIGAEHLEALFDAQAKHAVQSLGESETKEFVLTHIFQINPHVILRAKVLWYELLWLHYRDAVLPMVLAEHVAHVLSDQIAFKALPLRELFSSKGTLLRMVQEAWYRHLSQLGLTGLRAAEPTPPGSVAEADIPFEDSEVRVLISSMFLEGLLHPLVVQGPPMSIPDWAKLGVVQDPLAMRNLVAEGIIGIAQSLPTLDSPYRDWFNLSRRLGELLARFHALDSARAEGLRASMEALQDKVNAHLKEWLITHYADLPSLISTKGPIMVHHVPRFLSMRRGAGEAKIALLVFDGLAIDQWVQIREALAKKAPRLGFEESACFAWLPTLTSVSRQAIFSGDKPRDFSETIGTTAPEPAKWSQFWQHPDQGLRANEIFYQKKIQRVDQLPELEAALSTPSIKVVGLVIDTVDEIVHGAVLGKRGIAQQIEGWCETGFVDQLFTMLLNKGFHVYLTADHGNVEAIGQGSPKEGVAPEQRGERVRIYGSETLATKMLQSNPSAFRLEVPGLPAAYLPVFSGGRTAFIQEGEPAVVHGGISVEELLVPFVKISYVS